ncbi:MAG: hypothetical protein ACP5HS_01340 [Anaerolineae bacterium]
MFPQNTDLLLFVLIILGIGIVVIVGLLIWIFTRPKKKEPVETAAAVGARAPLSVSPQRGEKPEVDAPASDLGREGERPEGEGVAAPSGLRPVTSPEAGPHGFLTVRRGEVGWDIYVEGRRYPSLADVPDPSVREDVVTALRALAGFSRDYVKTRHEGTAAAPSSPATPARDVQPASPLTRPVSSPDAMLPTIDLAQEIGEIVDEMLARDPSLQGHSVRLTNLPGKGIAFAVDGKLYDDIDEIPSIEIRELIRNATREWERR